MLTTMFLVLVRSGFIHSPNLCYLWVSNIGDEIDYGAPIYIYFDPDEHTEDTLKAFEEFKKKFSLIYKAQFPDPKSLFGSRRPTMEEYKRNGW